MFGYGHDRSSQKRERAGLLHSSDKAHLGYLNAGEFDKMDQMRQDYKLARDT